MRAVRHASASSSGPAATRTLVPPRPSNRSAASAASAGLTGAAQPAELGGQEGGGQQAGVGGEQAHGGGTADAVPVEEVGDAVYLVAQLLEGHGLAALPLLRAGQHGERRPVGPHHGGAGQDVVRGTGQAAVLERDGLDRRQGARLVVCGPEQIGFRGVHRGCLSTVCWSVVGGGRPRVPIGDGGVGTARRATAGRSRSGRTTRGGGSPLPCRCGRRRGRRRGGRRSGGRWGSPNSTCRRER
ncbi:hypothetical protein SBADM41S_05703 [Streptomyces badius]